MIETKKSRSNGELERGKASIPGIGVAGNAQSEYSTESPGLQGRLALKPVEVAQLLGIGRNATYSLCHRADFPAIRVGASLIIPVDALRRWLDDQAEQGRGSL